MRKRTTLGATGAAQQETRWFYGTAPPTFLGLPTCREPRLFHEEKSSASSEPLYSSMSLWQPFSLHSNTCDFLQPQLCAKNLEATIACTNLKSRRKKIVAKLHNSSTHMPKSPPPRVKAGIRDSVTWGSPAQVTAKVRESCSLLLIGFYYGKFA